MKVCLYSGCLNLVAKSGIGHAVLHQQQMLEYNGVEVTFRDSPDAPLVHINTVFPDALLKAITAHILGKKVIYYGHSTKEDFKHSFRGSTALAPLFQHWIKLCYSRGDAIITPTEYSKRLLLSYGIRKPVFALSNGIDTEAFQFSQTRRDQFRAHYNIAPHEKAILSVGHYIERKGILDFIALARQNPDHRFFWFGYTDPRLIPETIRSAIKNAPSNLTFPGYVDSTALCDAYCGCDVFPFLSYEETEGIVVLEALSCQIPVIVRDIPVYDGWLNGQESVYMAADNVGFQRALDGILSGRWPDLRKAGRQVAEQRDVHQVGKHLLAIYEQLRTSDQRSLPL